MVDDPDIFHAARVLIDQYGANASMEGTERADWLLEQGDTEGAIIWRRIVEAIEELRRAKGHGEPLN